MTIRETFINNRIIIQSLFAEFICIMIFGFSVYSAILNTKFSKGPAELISICIAIAFCSVAIIYTFKDHTISHFNPAITLAAMITGNIKIIEGIGYMLMQFTGFIISALMVVVCFPGDFEIIIKQIRPGDVADSISGTNVFFSEFILTAILTFVAYQNGINCKRDPDISLYGNDELEDRTIVAPLVIGLTLGFLSLLSVTTSGSVFNPGIVLAPMLLSNTWPLCFEYFVSQFTGGLFGALLQVFLLFK